MNASNIHIKRVYLAADKADGIRILVDRLWPRNMSKAQASVQHWFKDIAPSNELRQWFSHDPAKWQKFREEYLKELKHSSSPEIETIHQLSDLGPVTLVYAAKDEAHNQAVVLKEYIVQS